MAKVKPEELICYCGVYGGTCARWQGHEGFRQLARLLGEWCDAQGFTHWMPGAVEEFDYAQFRKGLEFFAKDDSWLVCRKCCPGGDGYPECDIRKCCQERGHKVCFDCPEFPCPKAERRPGMVERGEEYRRLGAQRWLESQVKKAEQGFEHHIGRFVSLGVTDSEK